MKFLSYFLRAFALSAFGTVWILAGVYLYLSPKLPDVQSLRNVQLQTPMQIFTREGDLIGQFGEQKRNPMQFADIPEPFIQALLAAEDDQFFRHKGIDLMGLMRAVSELVLTGQKGSGGSTLTMQVARNYFLSQERTFLRKFNEILLSLQIERELSKEEIFELYFNRVFLGHRAYGFEAASLVYYGKSITDLSLAQQAMLAGIPKAPSRNNPITGPQAGLERRNWILGRMERLGFIDHESYQEAIDEPDLARAHGAQISFAADYAAEMARQQMIERYGMAAYNDGFQVYTTISSELQQAAQQAVIDGLITYDQRHGYRGPERQLPPQTNGSDGAQAMQNSWLEALVSTPVIAGLQPAIVSAVNKDSVDILLADASRGEILWDNGLRQASPYLSENSRGAAPKSPADLLSVGDMVRVRTNDDGAWQLSQVPGAQAALVSLSPRDGAIISLVGGMGFEDSKFNRATQAQRQPGSNFKPFLYAAALDGGFTAASLINDAPVVVEDGSLEGAWRPENDSGKFYGPTRLRWALTKSRNLVSIRLLQQLGVSNLLNYIGNFGFNPSEYPRNLSIALGTQVTTPLELATAYAVLANGGYHVEPYLISRIETSSGEAVYQARPPTVCPECDPPASDDVEIFDLEEEGELSMEEILAQSESEPEPSDEPLPAERVVDERVAFIITNILQDVIKRGTGRGALVLKRSDLAGKTGTTNGPMDAWFSGYNQDVVTTTWVGFDKYTPLGRREFGGTAALPIWIQYMRDALKDSPDRNLPLPPGVVMARIDPDSGLLAVPGQKNAIIEYFREEEVPRQRGNGTDPLPGQQNTDNLIRNIF